MFKNDDLIRDIILKDSTWKSTISRPEPVAGPIVDYEKRCGQLEQELADLKADYLATQELLEECNDELLKRAETIETLKASHQELKEMYEWLHQQHQELLGLVGELMEFIRKRIELQSLGDKVGIALLDIESAGILDKLKQKVEGVR